MCEKKQKVTLSDLILAAVCYLQEKNGVSALEISEFIAKRRGCKPNQIEGMVKLILCKAKGHGILTDKKGMYRIEDRYDDSYIQSKKENKAPVELSEDSEEDDDNDDDDDSDRGKCDPCATLKLSQEELTDDDDDEDDNKCKTKKRKCC